MTNTVQIDDVLWIGAYSYVSKGRWNDLNVAIKKIHLMDTPKFLDKNQKFWHEVQQLKRIRFQHIIQLYDIVKCQVGHVIVMEYAEMGSLSNVLENRSIKLDWRIKRRFF